MSEHDNCCERQAKDRADEFQRELQRKAQSQPTLAATCPTCGSKNKSERKLVNYSDHEFGMHEGYYDACDSKWHDAPSGKQDSKYKCWHCYDTGMEYAGTTCVAGEPTEINRPCHLCNPDSTPKQDTAREAFKVWIAKNGYKPEAQANVRWKDIAGWCEYFINEVWEPRVTASLRAENEQLKHDRQSLLGDMEKAKEDAAWWKRDALILVTLLKAKCTAAEWEQMNVRHTELHERAESAEQERDRLTYKSEQHTVCAMCDLADQLRDMQTERDAERKRVQELEELAGKLVHGWNRICGAQGSMHKDAAQEVREAFESFTEVMTEAESLLSKEQK